MVRQPGAGQWDGVWLKVKSKQKGLAFRVNAPGLQKGRSAATVYLQLHVDPLASSPLSADAWVRDEQWEKITIPLLYLAVYFNQVPAAPEPVVEPLTHLAFVLQLRGKIAGGAVGKGSVRSLGGYFIEADDMPGSDRRFAGTFSIRGRTTTKLPADLPAQ